MARWFYGALNEFSNYARSTAKTKGKSSRGSAFEQWWYAGPGLTAFFPRSAASAVIPASVNSVVKELEQITCVLRQYLKIMTHAKYERACFFIQDYGIWMAPGSLWHEIFESFIWWFPMFSGYCQAEFDHPWVRQLWWLLSVHASA